jgi:hypothetical protein
LPDAGSPLDDDEVIGRTALLCLDGGKSGAYDGRQYMGVGDPSWRPIAISLAGLLAAGSVVLTKESLKPPAGPSTPNSFLSGLHR